MERDKAHPVPWGVGEVVMGLAVFAAVALLTSLLLQGLLSDGALSALSFVAVMEVVVLLVAWRLGPARHVCSWRALGLRPANPASTMLLALGVVVAIMAFSSIYAFLAALVGPDWLQPPPLPHGLAAQEGAGRVAALLVAGVLGPFSEEVFFRGFVMPGLVVRFGFVGAAGASSFIFALAHGVVGVLLPTFIAGLLLAWLYRRTRSLWGSVAAHTVQNTLALSLVA